MSTQVRELMPEDIGGRMVEARKTAPRSPAQPSALKKVMDALIA